MLPAAPAVTLSVRGSVSLVSSFNVWLGLNQKLRTCLGNILLFGILWTRIVCLNICRHLHFKGTTKGTVPRELKFGQFFSPAEDRSRAAEITELM